MVLLVKTAFSISSNLPLNVKTSPFQGYAQHPDSSFFHRNTPKFKRSHTLENQDESWSLTHLREVINITPTPSKMPFASLM